MTTLFITGATGFIGQHLLGSLKFNNYRKIYCLSRNAVTNIPNAPGLNNIQYLRGNILETETYSTYLAESDIVIHLAATTGKAKREEYFKINADGTEKLIDQCKRLDVSKFLYVSSIAANFKKTSNYPYALSKLKAEQIVNASGLLHTILRPTIVIGPDSPILMSLMKLAKAPIVPIFGDGSVKIQPIYIEDLIACMLSIIENERFHNEILEIGGPEQISIERFIKRMIEISSNRSFRTIHIPIGPISLALKSLEKRFISVLPFTTGQLASFANDGTIKRNNLFERFASNMKLIDEMISLALSSSKKKNKHRMLLEQECERFTQYLAGCNPDKYLKKKYLEGHNAAEFGNNSNYFDMLLIKMASRSLFFTKLADVYTSVLYRDSVFRRKLILLLAILESYSITCDNIDSVSENTRPVLYLKILIKAFLFPVLFLLSGVAFVPFHVLGYFQTRHSGKSL